MAIIHRFPSDDDPIFASDFGVTTPLPRSDEPKPEEPAAERPSAEAALDDEDRTK
jgi:hypothetical protein